MAALRAARRPLSPREILAFARGRVPQIGLATVYRTIRVLLTLGDLWAVKLPGQPPRYQIAADPRPHLFIDERTDRVYTIEPPVEEFQPTLPEGFHVSHVQIICYGKRVSSQGSRKKSALMASA